MAAGASCTINVTFSPTSVGTGTKSAALNVNVAAPAISQSVSLTGSVIAPVLTLSPASLVFGSQTRGTTSWPHTVTVSNMGSAPLTSNGISIGGFYASQFAQTNICGTLPAILSPGASCAVSVTFRPTTVGTMNASMNVAVAAPTTSKSVSLSGAGR